MLKYDIYLDGSIFSPFIFIPDSSPSFSFLAFMVTYPGEYYKIHPFAFQTVCSILPLQETVAFPSSLTLRTLSVTTRSSQVIRSFYPFYSAPSPLLLEQKTLGREFPPFSFCQHFISSLKS